MKRIKVFTFSLLFTTMALYSHSQENYKFRDHTLDIEVRLDDLVSRLTLDEKISLLSETAPAITRIGVEGYNHGNDALSGVNRPGNFTVFPRPIGMAATFNPEAIEQMASYIGDEARARYNELDHQVLSGGRWNGMYSGLLTLWSPTINMARDPRWGRTGETLGEDPYLTSRMAVAIVKGYQGDGKYIKTIAAPKHFVANNREKNRYGYNAIVPERSLREYYFKGYECSVKEGKTFSIMTAYNAINGVPCTASSYLLEDVLRDEWGFEGYVVGDMNSPKNVYAGFKYAPSYPEAAAICLKNGLDLDSGFNLYPHLKEAVEKGYCSEDDVTLAVERVLRGRFKLGMFDPEELVPYNKLTADVVGCKAHQDMALQLAEQSIVMLKNDKNMLPFGKDIKKIALIGTSLHTFRHHQYSVEANSANPAVTPYIGVKKYCEENNIEMIEFSNEGLYANNECAVIESRFLKPTEVIDGKTEGLTGYYSYKENGKTVHRKRVDNTINIDRNYYAPDEFTLQQPLNIEWKGKLLPPFSGSYKFNILNNGAISFIVDGKEVTKGEETSRMHRIHNVEVYLEGGKEVDITLKFSDTMGNAACRFEWTIPTSDKYIESVLAKVADCDAAIMVMGTSTTLVGEGLDKMDLDMPAGQTELIQKVYSANKNVVLALINDVPLAINWENENIPSILELWYPGEQTGNALVNVLWGKTNPSGRLPITFAKRVEDLPDFDDYDVTSGHTYLYNNHAPLYEFGYGLSYTSFDYSNLKIDRDSYKENETIKVSFDVKNSGKMDGDEVAQLYLKPVDVETDLKVAIKQLKAFKRTTIQKGKTVRVELEVDVNDINYFDEKAKKFEIMNGKFEIQIGASSKDIRLSKAVVIDAAL
ncbi:MAG: glycoside hydrolase family 3 C-terminal domain-containing protein [Rikenellaceae bacterium]